MNHILIIGYVWPEPNSSAAGSRMLQLIKTFRAQGWKVTFASPAIETPHMVDLDAYQVTKQHIELNNASFDSYIKELNPNIIIFDRFMMEEQFGWRVTKQLPNALKILNTEDLHSLRKVRHESLKKGITYQHSLLLTSEIAKREIASIYRCDISLIISSYEIALLQSIFNIPSKILFHLPFLLDSISKEKKDSWNAFEDRNHFITIGNFRHAPNWDVTLYLKKSIWPLIKKELPKAEIHIYGSYPSEKVTQLNSSKDRFFIKGWVNDAIEVMSTAKICLAPLRFGAGIKGKFTESMLCGTPSVTTTIGAEGMHQDLPWSGVISDTPEEIAQNAIKLYKDKNLWYEAQKNGIEIINRLYNKQKLQNTFIDHITSLLSDIESHRTHNFIGSLLQHHSMRSTEFMSRWIEEKNK